MLSHFLQTKVNKLYQHTERIKRTTQNDTILSRTTINSELSYCSGTYRPDSSFGRPLYVICCNITLYAKVIQQTWTRRGERWRPRVRPRDRWLRGLEWWKTENWWIEYGGEASVLSRPIILEKCAGYISTMLYFVRISANFYSNIKYAKKF